MSNVLPYEDIAQELCSELIKICDDDHMVVAILSCVSDYEEDVKELLDFIKTGNDIDQETVSVAALDIQDRRFPDGD